MLIKTEKTLASAASKSGMDEKTARKYLTSKRLPSQQKKPHTWKTRKDPFEEVWDEICQWLKDNPERTAKSLLQKLQERYPEHYKDNQLRTLQRRVRQWRAKAIITFNDKWLQEDAFSEEALSTTKLGISIEKEGQRAIEPNIVH